MSCLHIGHNLLVYIERVLGRLLEEGRVGH